MKTRRYFAKFERIIGHLDGVAELSTDEGLLGREESKIIRDYLDKLSHTFTALSYKYLMTWRVSGALPNGMSVDRQDSGFPVFMPIRRTCNMPCRSGCITNGWRGGICFSQAMIRLRFGGVMMGRGAGIWCIGRLMTARAICLRFT